MSNLASDITQICGADDGMQTPMSFVNADDTLTDPIRVLWEDVDIETELADGATMSNRRLMVHFPREANRTDYTAKEKVRLLDKTYKIINRDDARSSNTVSLTLQLSTPDDYNDEL